jgi:hypothetical protein
MPKWINSKHIWGGTELLEAVSNTIPGNQEYAKEKEIRVFILTVQLAIPTKY